MKKTLIFYKPEYADLAIKLRDNYRAHDHEEADIVSVEEHDDIESGYTNRLPVSDVFYNDPKIDIDATVKSAFERGFTVIIPEGTNSTFNKS